MSDIAARPIPTIAAPVNIVENPSLDIAAPANINSASGSSQIAAPVNITARPVVAIGNPSE